MRYLGPRGKVLEETGPDSSIKDTVALRPFFPGYATRKF